MTARKIDDEFFLSTLVFENLEWLFGHEGKTQIHREIRRVCEQGKDRIFIGSYAEGIRYRGGGDEENAMFSTVNVITNQSQNQNGEDTKCNFRLETTKIPPGYCKLRVLPGYYFDADLYDVESEKQVYLSNKKFLERCCELSMDGTKVTGFRLNTHGVEVIYSMWIPWPSSAGNWITRNPHRAWPTEELVHRIVKEGCCLIPKGSSASQTSEWRMCFGTAELSLVSSFTHYQFILYQFFRIVVEDVITERKDDISPRDILTSYVVKHVFFWTVEESLPNVTTKGLYNRFFLICIDKLQQFIDNKFMPNYFIPEDNLFEVPVTETTHSLLKDRIQNVREVGIKAVLQCNSFGTLKEIIDNPSESTALQSPTPNTIQVQNDLGFLCETGRCIYDFKNPDSIELNENSIREGLQDTTLTAIQKSFLKTALANIYKSAGVFIYKESSNPLQANKLRYAALATCKAFLSHIPRRDIGEKPLMFATYFYLTGNYKNALDAISEMLSKFKPYTVFYSSYRGIVANADRDEAYKDHVSGRGWSYHRKAQEMLLLDIWVSQKKPLIASELHLEMELLSSKPFGWFSVPSLPYAYFLRFLCLKRVRLYDKHDLRIALSELQAVLYDEEMRENFLVSFAMTGICFEMLNEMSDALDCYVKSYRLAKEQKRTEKDLSSIMWRIGILLYKELSHKLLA